MVLASAMVYGCMGFAITVGQIRNKEPDMIYPKNFEQKIGFDEVRSQLKSYCLSPLGKERVDNMAFLSRAADVNRQLEQTREWNRLREDHPDFAIGSFFDCRAALQRIRLQGTHLETGELYDLRRSMQTTIDLLRFLKATTDSSDRPMGRPGHEAEDPAVRSDAGGEVAYPELNALTEGVITFPSFCRRIDQIIDALGNILDSASPELQQIRRELARTEGSISKTLYAILHTAQGEGLVDKDVSPTLRDGRLVIPVAPGLKRRIPGIIHDESASGRTVYIEPTQVVEANNRIRELESQERHEIIRILTEITKQLRPHAMELLFSYQLLAAVDFIQAKAHMSKAMKACEPQVEPHPVIDWRRAFHPLLAASLERQGKDMVPLDIMLTAEKHILIISGPNAGGKSVCLKTTGLLQYMLQCGLGIPVGERSRCGVFRDIMIDIGDEQSLENDLSTYSSHLLNMKNMMRQANASTLILIDEFGTGTEPAIGGAIAEAVLGQFNQSGAWAVITTHYQNLKHFADNHEGVANGAMLYDRNEMRPLFQLSIGRPGSSFAIEIARKIGLPEAVIKEASDIVGQDYIQSDKYLQDIVRDKRYWENKRQNIHQREKDMERTLQRYETDLSGIESQRKQILAKAKQEAEELLRESNKRIENAIREIRESQAEKEATKRIREELNQFKEAVSEVDTKAQDDAIQRKIAQIQQRRQRKAERKATKAAREAQAAATLRTATQTAADKDREPLGVGDTVRIKGLKSTGTLENITGNMCTVIFGGMRTKMRLDRLERASTAAGTTVGEGGQPEKAKTKNEEMMENLGAYNISRVTQDTMDSRRKNFHQDLDVRGMRGDEALNAVQYFIDDSILMGMPRVRILHGKGNGILRQLIRQYLATVPNVTHYRDEHVQFGGAGITVVDLG